MDAYFSVLLKVGVSEEEWVIEWFVWRAGDLVIILLYVVGLIPFCQNSDLLRDRNATLNICVVGVVGVYTTRYNAQTQKCHHQIDW